MKPSRFANRLRFGLLIAVGFCFAASIPWYRQGGEVSGMWLGLPDWVSVALVCYVVAAALNSAAWLLTDIPDEVDDEDLNDR